MNDAGGERGAAGRIRVGLTGLAVVFLLVLLAAAFFGLSSRGQGFHGGRGDPIASSSGANDQGPNEPLAELGVTPGNDPAAPSGHAAVPPRHPSRR